MKTYLSLILLMSLIGSGAFAGAVPLLSCRNVFGRHQLDEETIRMTQRVYGFSSAAEELTYRLGSVYERENYRYTEARQRKGESYSFAQWTRENKGKARYYQRERQSAFYYLMVLLEPADWVALVKTGLSQRKVLVSNEENYALTIRQFVTAGNKMLTERDVSISNQVLTLSEVIAKAVNVEVTPQLRTEVLKEILSVEENRSNQKKMIKSVQQQGLLPSNEITAAVAQSKQARRLFPFSF